MHHRLINFIELRNGSKTHGDVAKDMSTVYQKPYIWRKHSSSVPKSNQIKQECLQTWPLAKQDEVWLQWETIQSTTVLHWPQRTATEGFEQGCIQSTFHREGLSNALIICPLFLVLTLLPPVSQITVSWATSERFQSKQIIF